MITSHLPSLDLLFFYIPHIHVSPPKSPSLLHIQNPLLIFTHHIFESPFHLISQWGLVCVIFYVEMGEAHLILTPAYTFPQWYSVCCILCLLDKKLNCLYRKVCFLPGTLIRDVTKWHGLVQLLDYHPLRLLHVRINDLATSSPKLIKRASGVLGRILKNLRAQAVFFSIFPVMERDFGRITWAQDKNTWLKDWCHHQNFRFYNYGKTFEAQGMMGPDKLHLSQWWKCIFGHKLTVPLLVGAQKAQEHIWNTEVHQSMQY